MLNRQSFIQPSRWREVLAQAARDATRLLGPIFQIEAIITIRRARYYLLRAMYGLLLLFVLWTNYTAWFGSGTASVQTISEFGVAFFYSFASMQLSATLVVTVAMTAGTIAEERERRTIEYLFATDLSNSEIVLGKLTSRLLLIFLFVLTGLPILSLTLLFGGTDGGHLLQLFVVTVSTMAAAASVSMCISVWARRPREAIVRAFIVIFGILVLPFLSIPMALLRPAIYEWVGPVIAHLLVGNPFVLLIVMADVPVPFPSAPAPGWLGVGELIRNHALLSFFMLILAVWRLRRVYPVAGAPKRGSRFRETSWRLWRPPVGTNAMIWKEVFAEQSISGLGLIGRIVIAFLFMGILAPVGRQFFRVLQGLSRPEDFQELIAVLTTVMGSLYLLVLAARSSTSVTIEKERQSWETLVSTPLSGWDIVIGKILGNIYALRWLLVLMCILWGMAVALRPLALVSAILMMTTIALVCPFFVGMGLFLSLSCRTSTRAMCWSMLVSLFVGGGYALCAEPLIDMFITIGFIGRQGRGPILGPSVPYLLAWAGMEEMHRPPRVLSVAAFAVFVAIYCVLGVCLLLNNVVAFDRLAGRPSRWTQVWQSNREFQKVVVLTPEEPLRFPSEVTS